MCQGRADLQREIESRREQTETIIQPSSNATQTPADPPLTPTETNTPTTPIDPKYHQDQESTSRNSHLNGLKWQIYE